MTIRQGIVIIPCFKRPELLAACLVAIQRARGWADHEYLLSIDRDCDDRIYDVIHGSKIMREARVIATWRDHKYHGPAFNILSAWRESLALACDTTRWIALIEDDVLVASDFFEFIDDALALDPDAFGVSACRNQNRNGYEVPKSEIPTGIYQHTSYQSIGVALRPSSIECVLAWLEFKATVNYFEQPIAFCREAFRDRGLPEQNASQDGFIHRVVRKELTHMLYPVEPRAFHAGWYGTNRSDGVPLAFPAGDDWRTKAKHILDTLTDSQMNALADPRFRDIQRCELNRSRVPLKLV